MGFFVWLVYVLFIWLCFLKSTFSSSAPLTFNILKLSFSVTFFAFLSLTGLYKATCGGRMGPEINLSGNRNLL